MNETAKYAAIRMDFPQSETIQNKNAAADKMSNIARNSLRHPCFIAAIHHRISAAFKLTFDVLSMETGVRHDMRNNDERLKHQWIMHGCGQTGSAPRNKYTTASFRSLRRRSLICNT